MNFASSNYYGQFDSWYNFFVAIDKFFGDEKGVMFIDEYTKIIVANDGKKRKTDFQSSLQKAIDLLFNKRKFTLILVSSNVFFGEKEIGNYNTPLYQKNTFSLMVKKFEFNEALIALDGIKDDWTKALFLCLMNTFPYYLSPIDSDKSFENNLDHLFYNIDAVFVDNPTKMITSSKLNSWFYSSILTAIANGYDTIKEICTYLNADTNDVYNYIK